MKKDKPINRTEEKKYEVDINKKKQLIFDSLNISNQNKNNYRFYYSQRLAQNIEVDFKVHIIQY